MVFYNSLSDSKFFNVFRTALRVQADLNNAVVWIVPTRRLFSKSLYQSIHFCIECANYNWYHCHFHVPHFFNCLARSKYLPLFLLSFCFCDQPERQSQQFGAFFFCWLWLGLVVWLRLSCSLVSQSPREMCKSHFLGQIQGCACTISSYGQLKSLYNSQGIVFSRVKSYFLFALIYNVRVLYDWFFRLCNLIIYICYFVAS